MFDRRGFLRGTAIGLGLTWGSVPLLGRAEAPGSTGRHRLIVIMLRGAADALSIVVPYGDPSYYALRPNIAIPPPGARGGALDLDGRFGLHPALQPLAPLWAAKSLAFVTCCGSPDPTRSHFDGQAFIESGTPGDKTTSSGWMNRLLTALRERDSRARGVSFEALTPLTLKGPASVATMPLGAAAHETPFDRPETASAFDGLYADTGALGDAYREARTTRRELIVDAADPAMTAETRAADNGAPPPGGFPAAAARLARLLQEDPTLRLGFLSFGGWDTHADQGASQGHLAINLGHLGEGLGVLARGLGPAYADTTVVLISEFGRAAKENGARGTDHGHGSILWVFGGGIAGQRIYGRWSGLAPEHLHEGRDLPVTADFRAVLAVLIESQLGLDKSRLAAVFPGYAAIEAGGSDAAEANAGLARLAI